MPANTPGGTHSGIITAVRERRPNDKYFPAPSDPRNLVYQYEATYLFLAEAAILPVALPRGMVTVNGAFWLPRPPMEVKFAITGGTGPYALARGEVTESRPDGRNRTLDITL